MHGVCKVKPLRKFKEFSISKRRLMERQITWWTYPVVLWLISSKKWSRYRSGVAQRVGRGIALLFHDRGTRREWVVSSTPRPHFTPGKDPVPILQKAGWPPGPVWTGGKSRPHRDSIPDRPARSQSLYRLSYPGHKLIVTYIHRGGTVVCYKSEGRWFDLSWCHWNFSLT